MAIFQEKIDDDVAVQAVRRQPDQDNEVRDQEGEVEGVGLV